MSRSGEFCPRCGESVSARESGRTARDRALCAACYIEEYDLVDAPDRVEVTLCPECGAVQQGNRWVDIGAEDYTDVAIQAVTDALGVHVDATDISWEVAPEQVDETTIRMHCEVTGTLRGEPLAESIVVPVKFGHRTCDRCGRIAGGSYASTVQLRARDRDPTQAEIDTAIELARELVDSATDDGDRDAFITAIEPVQGGLDIQLSTNRLGTQLSKQIVDQLGGSYTDNETLVTEDADGNPVYRVNFAVRLPPYHADEVIAPDDADGPILVRDPRDRLTGLDLRTGEQYEASFEDGEAPDARRLGSRDDAQRTTVVTVEDEHAVQLLDPNTYESITVPRPSYFDPAADEVSVIRGEDGLYILPAPSNGADATTTGEKL